MYTILVRFNTEHNNTPLKWRVLINGVEHLTSQVICKQASFTTSEDVLPDGRVKHHITILAKELPEWQDDQMLIKC